MRLTDRQRDVLLLLSESERAGDRWAVVGPPGMATARFDGQLWLNWNTAYSLECRDLVEFDHSADGFDAALTEDGRIEASASYGLWKTGQLERRAV